MDAGKSFLNEFIDCYKSGCSLWDKSSPEYTSRQSKLVAYNQLLKVMKKYKNDSCITDVKKKINTLRSNFRREMKRIQLSEGNCDKQIYTPNLWWYDKFSFLLNVKNSKQSKTNMSSTTMNANTKQEEVYLDEYILEDNNEEQEEIDEDPVCSLEVVKLEDKRSKRQAHIEETYIQPIPKKLKAQEGNNLLMSYNVQPTPIPTPTLTPTLSGGDTFDHMCKAWAGNLREMDKTQRIIAGRAISEIIFQGQVGVLTFDSIPKMPVNSSFSSPSPQMVSNSTQVSNDPNQYSSMKSHELVYRQSRVQSRDDSSPKPATNEFVSTSSSSSSSKNTQIIHRPSKDEYISTAMEQQSYSTIPQFYDE